jgi:hypothetical protein
MTRYIPIKYCNEGYNINGLSHVMDIDFRGFS